MVTKLDVSDIQLGRDGVFFLKDFQAKGGEDRRCNFSFTSTQFQVFHPYLASLCILRHGILFKYTYIIYK